MEISILAGIIFLIAAIMTMTGRGGGNFYVLAIVFSGYGMHVAASTGQFILIVSSLGASVLFGKQKITDWKLVFGVGGVTFISAFLGGFFSGLVDDQWLKIVFAIFVSIASLLMLKPVKKEFSLNRKGTFIIRSGEQSYPVNFFFLLPAILLTGFISGMVGISGGSFLVPLMVLSLRVPMHIAVGTSTVLVMITATSGFLGHFSTGHFDYKFAIPLAVGGLLGGCLGAKFTPGIKPKKLKTIFAFTSLAAALLMVVSAVW